MLMSLHWHAKGKEKGKGKVRTMAWGVGLSMLQIDKYEGVIGMEVIGSHCKFKGDGDACCG